MLTKSRYVQGVRCQKLAWLSEYKPDVLKQDYSHAHEGQAVGKLARTLYPHGILVEGDNAIEKTQLLLQAKVPIFEAMFQVGRLLCKADILMPTETGWELIEVKSTTSVKPDHIEDLSFQALLIRESGITVTEATVLHINSKFVKQGDINVQSLFKKAPILIADTTKQAATTLKTLDDTEPTITLGSYCLTSNKRSDCPAKAYCWDHLPENNVMHLYNDKKLGFALLEEAISELRNIPEARLEGKHQIQLAALKANEPQVQTEKIHSFISKCVYPLYFFDLETFKTAIPLYENASPYQDIPFQFSLHVLQEDNTVTHHEFLADAIDPRPSFIDALAVLGATGTILAYNAGFEKGILSDCAEYDPTITSRIEQINSRFVDLIEPFKQFWYYHPKQQGSCSLKSVLPALTGISYDELTIRKGDIAAAEYYGVTYDQPNAEDKNHVREALLRYCELDTLAMVEIYRVLKAV